MNEILDHYARVPEDTRLESGWGRIEFERTREILQRHLPAPPARVLDVGGGAGPYSEWLGSLGYQTHLLDLAPGHVRSARRRPNIAAAVLGDGRRLPWRDGSAGIVLLLGPLYHLPEPGDRLNALSEARRVLCPGGLLFAAAICRFASLLAGLVEGFLEDPLLDGMLKDDLETGRHRNPTGDPRYFTTAFFHRPEELKTEILASGFLLVDLAPVEGVGWLARDFEGCWADPARRRRLLGWVRRTEREPALLALSPHLLAVARKPAS